MVVGNIVGDCEERIELFLDTHCESSAVSKCMNDCVSL